MKIAVIGLGLIGGSLCKAIKKNTHHTVMGLDINKESIKKAFEQEAIDSELSLDRLNTADISAICLYPRKTVEFILENLDNFKKGSIVIDCCGVKKHITDSVSDALSVKGVTFIGCHPMAGREFSGFDYAVDDLFDKASFIITPTEKTPQGDIERITALAEEIGFHRTVTSSAERHDKVIAFTSQLAHIVSSAYVKSPSIKEESGFSAGSFLDLTRVARLNEDMWTELFMLNRQPLIFEIETIIKHLAEYKAALENSDADTLCRLLRQGRELKERSTEYYNAINK